MNTEQHLPSTPSELIRVALADLSACERDDGYVVDMDDWHAPITDDRGREVCEVCLGGAVLAQTLGAEPHEGIGDHDLARYGSGVENKMNALNCFRRGEIDAGLEMLGYDVDKLSEEWEQYAYEAEYDKSDPDEFHARMNSLADYLESQGL